MSEVVYLYGYAGAGAAAPPAELGGIAERPVETLPVDGLQAVYSRVPADVYEAAAIEPRLQDLEWVAEQGLRHEQVVAWFVDRDGIVPVRLFTLYSSLDALEREARKRAAAIRAELERLDGLREWDLKVSYDAERLAERLGEASDEVAGLDREIEAAAPGRRFLLERKRGGLVAKEARRVARRLAGELLDAVRPHTRDVATVPPPRDAEAGAVVLNAALLVTRDAEPTLRREVEERGAALEERGLDVRLTGPWAAYRFVGGAA